MARTESGLDELSPMMGCRLRWLVSYDCLLPLMVWFISWLASLAFPNRRGLIEIFAILLPVMGFLIHCVSGRMLSEANAFSNSGRRW